MILTKQLAVLKQYDANFIGIPYPSTVLIKAKTGSEISVVDIRKIFGSYGLIKGEIETFTKLHNNADTSGGTKSCFAI